MNYFKAKVLHMKIELKADNGQVFYTLEYLPKEAVYYSRWFGSYLPVEYIKQAALLYLEEIKKNPCPRLLNDNREVEGVWDEANQWLAEEWIPAALAAGLKKFAHIYSPDLYAQLSADFLADNVEKTPGAFEIRLFDSYDTALEWLVS